MMRTMSVDVPSDVLGADLSGVLEAAVLVEAERVIDVRRVHAEPRGRGHGRALVTACNTDEMSDPLWFTTTDGLQIAYDDWGSDTSRPPVVLHHGFAANAYLNWVAPGVVKALTATGRRVVTIDARGHGRSDHPHDSDFYGETKMATDVSTLADVLGVDEFDLVGYSMGAIVSVVVASHDPRVRRMVIGGIGASVAERGGVDTRAMAPAAVQAALLADDPSTITDRSAASLRAFADSTGADRLALAAQAARVHRQPIELERITVPTLVIAGRDDPVAARPQVLADAIAGAKLTMIGGDHVGAVGTPEFAPAIVEIGRASCRERVWLSV